jgi:hypothetical protein
VRTSFRASFLVACCAAVSAVGCTHETEPPVSAATLTSSYVAAPPPKEPSYAFSDAMSSPPAGPDDSTSSRVPALFIADAPRPRPAPTTIPPLTRWEERYPDAARLLAEWSQSHGAAAYELGQWTRRQPDQMATFVNWAITNVEEPLGAFFFNRSTFRDLERVVAEDRDAVDGLLVWIRRAPTAALELSAHPGSLAFTTLHENQLAGAHSSLGRTVEP